VGVSTRKWQIFIFAQKRIESEENKKGIKSHIPLPHTPHGWRMPSLLFPAFGTGAGYFF